MLSQGSLLAAMVGGRGKDSCFGGGATQLSSARSKVTGRSFEPGERGRTWGGKLLSTLDFNLMSIPQLWADRRSHERRILIRTKDVGLFKRKCLLSYSAKQNVPIRLYISLILSWKMFKLTWRRGCSSGSVCTIMKSLRYSSVLVFVELSIAFTYNLGSDFPFVLSRTNTLLFHTSFPEIIWIIVLYLISPFYQIVFHEIYSFPESNYDFMRLGFSITHPRIFDIIGLIQYCFLRDKYIFNQQHSINSIKKSCYQVKPNQLFLNGDFQ